MVIIKKLGVLSFARINGLIGIAGGLFAALFTSIISLLMKNQGAETQFRSLGIGGMIMLILISPVIYGIIGFIGGAVGAWLYNIFAKLVGGVEVELGGVKSKK